MSSLSRAANFCLFSWFIVLSGVKANIFQNQDSNSWYQDGVRLIQQNLKVKPNTRTARNAVVFLGDGMGVTTVTAARILAGQLKGNPGEETELSWEQFPWSALAKTYAADLQGTDSASSMTAILCGVKTNEDILGVDERVKKDDCSSLKEENKAISILALAENAGMSTGIVTTTRVTHATPASAYAHSANRDWEADADFGSSANAPGFNCKDIASQLVDFPYGNGIEVIFGGGRRKFLHQGQADPEYPGLFEYSHMKYEVNRLNDTAGEPSIEEMTEKAIKILQKNPKGFFLLVEGGRIDHGHHSGRAVTALHDAVAMDKAVAKTKQIVDREETLITVTADHSHVFTIGGYPKRGNPLFGLIKKVDNQHALDLDGKPYTTLGYANGPGGLNGTRPNITNVHTADKKYRQQATVLLRSETHGSEDVGIFADGPGAYLFHGVVEQQYIFHVLDHALCLSQSKQNSCYRQGDRRQVDINSAANEKLSISSMFAGILLLRVLQFLWT
ncbi:Alkaline phosphatase [Acropora cervicornis]|uniref:alkaline phosphatase n=1 Tax=Acropora cervicornis TaxID=6130 RepID=A0AAD9R019_ACRCE|nr:Alkaline phosphatase [Acropora cervicornis]